MKWIKKIKKQIFGRKSEKQKRNISKEKLLFSTLTAIVLSIFFWSLQFSAGWGKITLISVGMLLRGTDYAIIQLLTPVGVQYPNIPTVSEPTFSTPQTSIPTENTTSSETTSEGEIQSSSTASSSIGTDAVMYPVKAVTLLGTGNVKFGKVEMTNKSSVYTFNIEEILQKVPDVKVEKNSEPQVLIYHTHTSEAFLTYDTGSYPSTYDARTNNGLESVITVGDVLAQKLNECGIVTIHDTTYHDDPAYNGAYTRSLATVEDYLEKYPSIKVILDVHRDCLEQSDKTKLKPTVTINGKKAAQIMIVSGCDDYNNLGYPDWRENLVFGLQLQAQIAEDNYGLARPLLTRHIRYNQHLSHAALLLEFGTEANTVEEVRYSAELFAQSLIKVLDKYGKG